jgi:hypothetical protein
MAARAIVVCYWMALCAASAVAFQPAGGQGEFVPASSLPPGDQLAAAPLLIAAYAFVWVAAMVYLWSIWRRLTKVEADMRAFERRRSRPNVTR